MTRQAMQVLVVLLLTVGLVAGCGGEDGSPSDAWVGKTFLLDTPSYPAIYWTEPGGFGGDIGAYVPQFLIGVEKGAVKDELKINLTTALEGAQDLCVPTTQVTASNANYPLLDIVASAFPMRIWDPEASRYVPTTATNVILANLLPGNTDSALAKLQATLDVAELYPLFWQIVDPATGAPTKEAVCDTFLDYEVPCQTCASSGQPYCLTVAAVQMSAQESPTPIQIVTSPSCSS